MAPDVEFSPNVLVGPKKQDIRDHQAVFTDILKKMFSNYRKVAVEEDLGSGTSFSGSWVFMVKLFRQGEEISDLPVVVKIAAVSLIEKERRAYQAHIEGKWVNASAMKGDAPVYSADGKLSGLYYDFEGGGVFPVESLRRA